MAYYFIIIHFYSRYIPSAFKVLTVPFLTLFCNEIALIASVNFVAIETMYEQLLHFDCISVLQYLLVYVFTE
jgi:hypothetical protein